MADMLYDVIVVGAGIEGSATAYYLAQRGKKTLLLEQFPLPHSRGSSHGQSRITRKAYKEDFFVKMMIEATDMWKKLEAQAGWEIFRPVGFLAIGKVGSDLINNTADSLRQSHSHYELLSPQQFKDRFPMLRYSDNHTGVYDPDGGLLRADKALMAFQSQFKKYGGHLEDGAKVTHIQPGDTVTVRTAGATYRAKSVVFTPGPWAPKILDSLGLKVPLKPLKITVCYWKENEPGSHSEKRLPTFLEDKVCGPYDVYGLPSVEYPGHAKICLHHGPVIDPDTRDQADSSWVLDMITHYVREHFPCLESTPSITETCIYTNTPDENPVLDYHPRWKNIVFGVGFSGHGFKMSPVIGKILGQLALRETPSHDMLPFRLARFVPSSNL